MSDTHRQRMIEEMNLKKYEFMSRGRTQEIQIKMTRKKRNNYVTRVIYSYRKPVCEVLK